MFSEYKLNLFDIKHTLKYWSHVKPIGNIKTAEDIANLFEKCLTYWRYPTFLIK